MSREYIFEWVEFSIPRCSLTWGVSPCTAVLSASKPRKCWNLRADCKSAANFTPGTPLTLRFCKDGPMPRDVLFFPVLESVNASSPTVNIAGSDPDMSSLGKLATLNFELSDFSYHERGIDPYQSERISGAAQFSSVGYNPADQGMFLAKIKARWPYYADTEVIYGRAYLVDGVLTDITRQYYFIKDMAGPNDGSLKVKALGVLDLANKKTALAPRPSNGVLNADLTAVATTFTITPEGAGDAEYAASGRLTIGSEVMGFTRSGDIFTVTRGQRGTNASSHSEGDTVQQALSYTAARLDDVMADLVQNFTETPATYLDAGQLAENAAEVDRWGTSILLTTDITTPTGVATLLAELGDLGCTIWEDEFSQKLKLRMNRPLDTDVARTVTDRSAKEIRSQDHDENRLTQVLFYSKRRDPTKGVKEESNYDLIVLTTDPEAYELYGGVRSRQIFTRWLDQGDESTIAIAALRLLDRFRRAPKEVEITLDAREKAVRLVDVLEVSSDELAGADGLPRTQYLQVLSRSEPVPYHEVKVICQVFQFDGRYAFIAPDDAPDDYDDATETQKASYAFIAADPDGFPSDDRPPYLVI